MQITGMIQAVSIKPSKYPDKVQARYNINNIWYSCFTTKAYNQGDLIEFDAIENTTPKGTFYNIDYKTLKLIEENRNPPKNDLTSYLDKQFTFLNKKLNDLIGITSGAKPNPDIIPNNTQEFINDDIPF